MRRECESGTLIDERMLALRVGEEGQGVLDVYEGVGAVALARGASSAHDAAIYWGLAERKFEQYVRGAEQTNPKDRFLGAAKARHASCKAEREKAEKKRAKEPLKRTDEEELPL